MEDIVLVQTKHEYFLSAKFRLYTRLYNTACMGCLPSKHKETALDYHHKNGESQAQSLCFLIAANYLLHNQSTIDHISQSREMSIRLTSIAQALNSSELLQHYARCGTIGITLEIRNQAFYCCTL